MPLCRRRSVHGGRHTELTRPIGRRKIAAQIPDWQKEADLTISLTEEFRSLVDRHGGPAAVAGKFAIGRRTLNRMLNGSQPPPNKLLDEMRGTRAQP